MENAGSISQALEQAREGDHLALQRLWERYFDRLARYARGRIPDRHRRVMDEEDVALSALNSFAEGLRQGRYPQLTDRDELWRLLICITFRKAQQNRRYFEADKRGGGKVRGESVFLDDASDVDGPAGIAMVMGKELTPDFAAQIDDEFRRLMAILPDDGFRQVAHLKIQGYQNKEIAQQLGRSMRHVERRLGLIRDLWQS